MRQFIARVLGVCGRRTRIINDVWGDNHNIGRIEQMNEVIKNKSDYKPILLTFAVERSTDSEEKQFHYDYDRDMNVWNTNPAIPFVEVGRYCMDSEPLKSGNSLNNLMELYTKTEHQRERDDDGSEMEQMIGLQIYRELMTKTFADRERDDEDDVSLS